MSGSVTTATGPGVVTFDYGAWSARYPDLAQNVSATLAAAYFEEATLYLDNSPASPCRNTTRRTLLLNMIVAHIATLNLTAAQGGTGVVGRVKSATRGSVSVDTDMGASPGSSGWFMQTQPGASYWQASAFLRQARYIPGMAQRPWVWP